MQTQKLVHDNNFKDVLMTERALNCMPDKKIVALKFLANSVTV